MSNDVAFQINEADHRNDTHQPRDFAFGYQVAASRAQPSAAGALAELAETTGMVTVRALGQSHPDNVQAVAQHFTEVKAALVQLDEAIASAHENDSLTPKGKVEAITAMATKTLDILKRYEDIAAAHERDAKVAAEGFAREGDVKPPEGYDWTREVADVVAQLRSVDALRREQAYGQALEAYRRDPRDVGAGAVVAAIENAGSVFNPETSKLEPLVDPLRVRENKVARARETWPEVAATHDRAEALAGAYRGFIGGIKAAIGDRASLSDAREIEVL